MSISFEDNMKKLEKIVSDLEGGEIKLEDSIKMFEEGIGLAKELQKTLDEAEGKIKVVTEKGLSDFE